MNVDHFQAFLDAVEPERGATVLSAVPLPGGYSRDTVLAEVRWADGTTEKFVLRGDPAEESSVFRSDRADEWAMLQAVKDLPNFRIPTPRYFDATGEYMGCKAIVSEAIDSTSMQKFLDTGPDLDKAREDFVAIMASAHNTPLESIHESIERPTSWIAHIEDVIANYERMLDIIDNCDPVLRYTLKKIRMNMPTEVPMVLVHGDLQPGNFLLSDGTDPYIIDWEFSRIGDPRLDIGYYLQIPMPPHLYHPDPEAFLTSYRALTGLTEEQINPAIAKYFLLLGTSHLMVDILQGTKDVTEGRHRGVMGTYLMTAYAHFHNLYLDYSLELPYPEVSA
ncbi:MAG: phosphotransferase [Actinobacteria bacterium]|nr:phosphotransferase [Actinomycetota bacterium]